MPSRHILACVLLVIASLNATPVRALEIFCVDSVAELNGALHLAEYVEVEIHVVRGEYDVDNSLLSLSADFQPMHDVAIIGGYTPGCSWRAPDPLETVLFGISAEQTTIGAYENMSMRFESLTLRDLNAEFTMHGADGYFGVTYTLDFIRLKLERTRVLARTDVVNFIHVIGTDAPPDANGCFVSMLYPETVQILYSVFTGNNGQSVCIDGSGSTLAVLVANSIFWNNDGMDLWVRLTEPDAALSLYTNILQSTSFQPQPTEEVVSLNADPLFVNPGEGDYRLQAGSPAINSTVPIAWGQTEDIDGGPRWTGSAPDRGAYESSVDDTLAITVTNASDQISPLLEGSLRWAITQSNSDPDTNTIRFDIPGDCPHIIHLDALLPDITDRVIIDGYTQPGSAKSTSSLSFNATLCVGVSGDSSVNHALRVPVSVGASESVKVSGLGFGGFDLAAIRLEGGSNSWVHGNQFGGALESEALGSNAVNARIAGTSRDNLIGGAEPSQRNLIMSASNAGIELLDNPSGAEGYGNDVINNFIGTNASGMDSAGNNLGIRVRTHENKIKSNVISGNLADGVVLEGALANDNEVSSNQIGLKSFAVCLPQPCDPDYALGNIHFGVLVDGGSGNRIQFNEVAHNGSKGIRLFEGQRNRLLGNSVHDNASLGIDVGVSGVNPEYPASGSDQLANFGINAPSISGARGGQHAGRLTGLVSARGATSYVMQAFSTSSCDASGHGEGQTLVGTKIIAIGGSPGSGGTVEYEMRVESNGNLQPRFIATTWFDADGNSSEFSNCVPYQCDQIFAHDFDSAQGDSCAVP